MPLPNESAILAILAMTAVTFATRAFPFAVFRKRKPGKWFDAVEKNLPPMLVLILAVYASAGIAGTEASSWLPSGAAIAATLGMHVLLSNAFFSIAGGTAVYMSLTFFLK